MVMTWLKYIGIFLVSVIVMAIVAMMITQRVSDGPIEFLQGGPFKTGEWVDEPVKDWSFGLDKGTEFELVGFGTSRTAGYILHEGVPYMTCDLGFMWNRFEGQTRWILNLIYIFKRWHKDAVEDGRAVLRIEGKRYNVNFTKVEDPELDSILRTKIEQAAREYFATDLGPRPTEPPNDIWFFRIDQRI